MGSCHSEDDEGYIADIPDLKFCSAFGNIPEEALKQVQIANVAVSHSLLVIIYHVLRDKKPYTDLGTDYFDKLDTARVEHHHVRRLEQLGYDVTLTPKHVA